MRPAYVGICGTGELTHFILSPVVWSHISYKGQTYTSTLVARC